MPEEINFFIENCLFQAFCYKDGKVYDDIKSVLKTENRDYSIDFLLDD